MFGVNYVKHIPHYKMHLDPAIMRLNEMHENRYKYFRWTKRTAWLSFCYIIVGPAVCFSIGYFTDGKYNFRAKQRGDLIVEY